MINGHVFGVEKTFSEWKNGKKNALWSIIRNNKNIYMLYRFDTNVVYNEAFVFISCFAYELVVRVRVHFEDIR